MCIYIYIFSCGSSPFCAFAQKCVKPRCYNEKKALASFYPFGAVSYIWPFQEFPVRKSPWHFQHLQVSAQAPRTKTGGRAPWLSLRRCPWNTRSSVSQLWMWNLETPMENGWPWLTLINQGSDQWITGLSVAEHGGWAPIELPLHHGINWGHHVRQTHMKVR